MKEMIFGKGANVLDTIAIERLLTASFDELSEHFGEIFKPAVVQGRVLYGEHGVMNSMHLVALIAMLEEKIADNFGMTVELATDDVMSSVSSPFRSFNSIVVHVLSVCRAFSPGDTL